MEAYTSFAQVYDLFQDNIPYGEWADYLKSLLNEYGVKDGLVLDLGCGSGILSVAAALCGSEIVRGVDIDPDAAAASLENAEKNHLSDRIEIRQGDVTEGLGFSADIIVANLIADLIIGLSDDIAKHLSGKKIFISSGILAEKCDKVVSAISDSGFEVLEILEEEGWCAVAAQLKG